MERSLTFYRFWGQDKKTNPEHSDIWCSPLVKENVLSALWNYLLRGCFLCGLSQKKGRNNWFSLMRGWKERRKGMVQKEQILLCVCSAQEAIKFIADFSPVAFYSISALIVYPVKFLHQCDIEGGALDQKSKFLLMRLLTIVDEMHVFTLDSASLHLLSMENSHSALKFTIILPSRTSLSCSILTPSLTLSWHILYASILVLTKQFCNHHIPVCLLHHDYSYSP